MRKGSQKDVNLQLDSPDIVSVLSMDSTSTCSTLQGHEQHQNKPVWLKKQRWSSSHGERLRELINLSCNVHSIKVFTMTSTWTLTLKWNKEDWLRCHFHKHSYTTQHGMHGEYKEKLLYKAPTTPSDPNGLNITKDFNKL